MGQKKCTAAEIIGNLGAWENKWKWTPQAAVADEYVSPDSQPDNRALQSKLNEMEGKLKRFQAQADRDTTAKNQQRDSGKGDGPARKKAKGGAPWGQAQGQGSGKQWQGSGKKGGGKKHRR